MLIGQLAERAGVNPKTLRYYEEIGILAAPERTHAGYRVYDESSLELVTFVKAAQRLGLRLDEIKEILAFRERGEQPCAYVRDVLRREVGEIDDRITELQRLRDELSALDRLADAEPGAAGHDSGPCPLIGHARESPRTARTP